MINQINASILAGSSYKTESSQTAATKNSAKTTVDDSAAYTLELGSTSAEGTKSHGLSADDIKRVKDQVDLTTSGLRDLVQNLMVKQTNNTSSLYSVNIQILGSTGAVSASQPDAQSADGGTADWGVSAVSDKIVEFAKSVSGGDTSKLQVLKDAIEKGFASAKKTLGGTLPDISNQTHDAIMSKLDDWANETEATAAGQ